MIELDSDFDCLKLHFKGSSSRWNYDSQTKDRSHGRVVVVVVVMVVVVVVVCMEREEEMEEIE